MKSVFFSLMAAVFILGLLYIPQPLALEKYNLGTYTFYYGSANFKTVPRESAAKEKYVLKNVRGESVCFSAAKATAQDVLSYYRAKVVFVEEVNGIVSYYAETAAFDGGVDLNGREINLHIAVGGDRITVGTPLIFGGF
jgi:hypothetical protein